jgi:endoglucanase
MRFSILIPLTILSLTVAGPVQKRRNFWYFGVNESGAEFGNGNIPGTLGTDYTWPVDSTIDVRPTKILNYNIS